MTEYMQVSMLVNTMLYFNKRYLHIFNHPRLYPSTLYIKFMQSRYRRFLSGTECSSSVHKNSVPEGCQGAKKASVARRIINIHVTSEKKPMYSMYVVVIYTIVSIYRHPLPPPLLIYKEEYLNLLFFSFLFFLL